MTRENLTSSQPGLPPELGAGPRSLATNHEAVGVVWAGPKCPAAVCENKRIFSNFLLETR